MIQLLIYTDILLSNGVKPSILTGGRKIIFWKKNNY